MMLLNKFKLELVDDWRDCLKWASVQLNGALLIVCLVAQAMPALDPSLAAALPAPLRNPATGIYAALVLAVRVLQLKKANG